jgi:hypothetical protein
MGLFYNIHIHARHWRRHFAHAAIFGVKLLAQSNCAFDTGLCGHSDKVYCQAHFYSIPISQ